MLLARHLNLDRLVAVKVMHAGSYDPDGQRRLEREGRAVVSLRHPNIVTVHDLRATPVGLALVMEYLPGGDLRGLVDSGALAGSHAVRLLAEIAAGLAHAHAAGVVHRDVKPANVLLTADGHAKIGDFGLARLSRAGGAFRTVDGTSRGSPAYLAPEQIIDPTRESPAADAYSFAVIAYELVVGQRPFAARTVGAMINAQLNETPRAPRELAPGLPDDVGWALLAGLAKQPEARPSPQQLVEALSAFTPAEWDGWFATRRTVPHAVRAAEPADTIAAGSLGAWPGLPVSTDGPPPLPPASTTPSRPSGIGRRLRRARIAVLICAIALGSFVGLAIAVVARQW